MTQRTDFAVQSYIGNVADPVNPQDAVTKKYADTQIVTRLDKLADVSIVEPVFSDSGNTIASFTATVITTSSAVAGLVVGDWIRGDNTVNGAATQITAISGSTITVSSTANLGFVTSPAASALIYKLSAPGIANQVLRFDLQTNKWIASTDVIAVAVNGATPISGVVNFIAGTNTTVARITGTNDIQINAIGGSSLFTSTGAIWTTAGVNTKDAYTLYPGTINNQGITLKFVAGVGSGQITGATVTVNGTALANTYASTGTWPNLSIVIPLADVTGLALETAAQVDITVAATFASVPFTSPVGSLVNVQPVFFTETFAANYTALSLPYYTNTSSIDYAYGNNPNATAWNATITPAGGTLVNASLHPTGTTAAVLANGATIGGSATGTGTHGAGSSTVSFSGTIAAVTTYIPAFYAQTTGASASTPPTLTNASSQTAGAATGSYVSWSLASTFDDYNWIAVPSTIALTKLLLTNPWGVIISNLIPDVTTTQTIDAQLFNVYGFTKLSTGAAGVPAKMYISA